MAKNALERLFEDAQHQSNLDESQYSIDEQLEVEDDEFLNAMSDESKAAFLSKIQKVNLDEEPVEVDVPIEEENYLDSTIDEENEYEEPIIEENIEEDQPKRGRGRPRKIPIEEQNTVKNLETDNDIKINSMNEFMDSLAVDLIEDLKKSNYQTRNYSKEQMLVILNYLKEKI